MDVNDIFKEIKPIAEGVLQAFGQKPSTPRKLTEKEQVDLYLKLSEKDLEGIRSKRGDFEFNRYNKRMLELAKRYYPNA